MGSGAATFGFLLQLPTSALRLALVTQHDILLRQSVFPHENKVSFTDI